jgi:putative endonuclease
MNQAHYLGQTGEEAALNYLKANGYSIRQQNWRYRRIELDIIAETPHYLVVVEVKSRRNTLFKDPFEAVDYAKMRRIVMAAHAYVLRYGINKEVRFDIIEVVSTANGFAINHIADAFVPPVE